MLRARELCVAVECIGERLRGCHVCQVPTAYSLAPGRSVRGANHPVGGCATDLAALLAGDRRVATRTWRIARLLMLLPRPPWLSGAVLARIR